MKPLPADPHVLHPVDIVARWQCDVEAIYGLIKKGVLPAFSTSPNRVFALAEPVAPRLTALE